MGSCRKSARVRELEARVKTLEKALEGFTSVPPPPVPAVTTESGTSYDPPPSDESTQMIQDIMEKMALSEPPATTDLIARFFETGWTSVPCNVMIDVPPCPSAPVDASQREPRLLKHPSLFDLMTVLNQYRTSEPEVPHEPIAEDVEEEEKPTPCDTKDEIETKDKKEVAKPNFIRNIKSKKVNDLSTIDEDMVKRPPMVFDSAVVKKTPTRLGKLINGVFGREAKDARTTGKVDEDLLYHLRLYSAFQPRTMAMANSLKMRALRFIDDHNSTNLTSFAQYELIIASVTEAMIPGKMELTFRKRMEEEATSLDSINSYFRSGRLSKEA